MKIIECNRSKGNAMKHDELEQEINNKAAIRTLSRIKLIEVYKRKLIVQYEMVCPVTGGHSGDWFYTILDPKTYKEMTVFIYEDLEMCKRIIDAKAYKDNDKIHEILLQFNEELK